MMMLRNLVVGLLFITVVAPILLYTDRLATFTTSSSGDEFVQDATTFAFNGRRAHLNVLPHESASELKEPVREVYSESSTKTTVADSSEDLQLSGVRDHKSARALSTTDEEDHLQKDPIKSVTDVSHEQVQDGTSQKSQVEGQKQTGEDAIDAEDKDVKLDEPQQTVDSSITEDKDTKPEQRSIQTTDRVDKKELAKTRSEKQDDKAARQDSHVQHLKDQLIRARVYLSLPSTKTNPHYTRDLRLRMREVQKALGVATKDSELPKNANDRLRAMEEMLTKGRQMQDDCATVVKKLRAMLHTTEEQLRVHKKQTMFLTQLTAKTLPKGLHCLPLRLTTEYYTLNSSDRNFVNQEKLENPQLYHYAIFSDNILAAGAVVNSTVTNAKEPSKHVFHIVTDRLNYAAMRMWFLVNPPGKATIQVQNIEEFTWLNASYSPVLKQLGSPSMIEYYFKAHRSNSDSNLKFRNPKYLSILNHLRFYLPEIFPKLNKVLFLDDDTVVQKDLTGLWSIDLKGNVNGAVETCKESFHRFDRYLNFSHPLIAKNFDPRACGWAYGMNIFDLAQWRRQNITDVYHTWQKLNHDRQLWKLGTLPPGLITFWKNTFPLNRYWHVLGLGYDPNVNQKDIDRAAVVHYNGNMKPWLEIGLPKYRSYWSKYVDYEHKYLRECNINP